MILTIKMTETELRGIIASQMRCKPDDVFFDVDTECNTVGATITTILDKSANEKQGE